MPRSELRYIVRVGLVCGVRVARCHVGCSLRPRSTPRRQTVRRAPCPAARHVRVTCEAFHVVTRARRGRGATSSGACMVCARLPLTRFARATGVGLCRYGYDLRVYLHPCNRRGVAVSVAGVVSVSRVSNRLHLIRTSGEPCATEAPHTERAAVQSRTTSHSNAAG